MEKFNKILAALKKYQFWVFCGVAVVAAVACWWMATRGLAGELQSRKTTIERDFQGAVIQPNHPNQNVIDKIHNQHRDLEQAVYGAWQVLYDEQKKKNSLPPELDDEFKGQFEKLKPKEDLPSRFRARYQNTIMRHLPALLTIIDVLRPAEEKEDGAGDTGTGGNPTAAANGGKAREQPVMPDRISSRGSGRSSVEVEWIGTVAWYDSDYQELVKGFDWKETPSTLRVLLAQEDLWVYEALLRIIKMVNKGATNNANAAVKRIDALKIGQDAVRAWSGTETPIFQPTQTTGGPAAPVFTPPSTGGPSVAPQGPPIGSPSSLSPGPSPSSMRSHMQYASSGSNYGASSSAGATGSGSDESLIENRYVDDTGKPAPFEAGSPYYAKLSCPEYKMMPLYMKLVMDQRRLPNLLVQCANSSMPIEVRRIRILKTQGGTLDLGTSGPSMSRPRGGSPRSGGDAGGGPSTEADPNDIPVEIQGVIYIYNPPESGKLGASAASAAKPADVTTPVAAGGAASQAPATAAPATQPGASPPKPSNP